MAAMEETGLQDSAPPQSGMRKEDSLGGLGRCPFVIKGAGGKHTLQRAPGQLSLQGTVGTENTGLTGTV